MTTAKNLLDICEAVDPLKQPMEFTQSFTKDGMTANFKQTDDQKWELVTTTIDGKDAKETPLWDDQVDMPTKPEEIKSLMEKHGFTPVDAGTNSLDVKDDTKEVTAKVK